MEGSQNIENSSLRNGGEAWYAAKSKTGGIGGGAGFSANRPAIPTREHAGLRPLRKAAIRSPVAKKPKKKGHAF